MTERLGPHVTHSRQNPCPTCGGARCVTFEDGATLCLRVESPRRTQTGIGWMHPGDAPDWRDRPHQPRPAAPESPLPDPVILDRGLRFLLAACPLLDADRDELIRRGLTHAQVDELPVGSLPDDGPDRAAIATALVEAIGPTAYGTVPGLYADEHGAPRIAGYPGILLGSQVAGRLVGLQVRPHDHTIRAEGKYRWLSSGKRSGGVSSGAPCGVVFPIDWDPASPVTQVIATEGIPKGYVAANKLGLPVVTMPGATITAGVLPLVQHLGATEVLVAYDTDRATNPHVAHGEAALTDELTTAGLTVARLTWPDRHKGLDDALAAGIIPIIEPVTTRDGAESPSCGTIVDELTRELATRTRERDDAKHTVSNLITMYLNPHLKPTDKLAYAATMALVEHKRQRAAVEADGRVVITAAEIANDYRPVPPPGERVATHNGDGSRPRMSRSQVSPILAAAAERGTIAAFARPAVRQKANRSTYTDTEWVITPAASPAAFLAPAATWNTDQPKERKPRTLAAECPHCHEVHDIVRKDYCHGCGSERASTMVRAATPPPTPDVDIIISDNLSQMPHGPEGEASPRGRVNYSSDNLSEMNSTIAAQADLAAADRATTRDDLHHATDRLTADLAPLARERGRSPVPKPTNTAGDDAWTC